MIFKYKTRNNKIISILFGNESKSFLKSRIDALDFNIHKFYYDSDCIYWVENEISLIDIKNYLKVRVSTLAFDSEKKSLSIINSYLREEKISTILD